MESKRDFKLPILFTLLAMTPQVDTHCTDQCNWLQSSLTTVCIGIHCLPVFKKETRNLLISDSQLTDIPENTFSDFDNLTKVHIQNCKIGRLKSHSFNTSRTLKDIYINHAVIGVIEKYALEKTTFTRGGAFNIFEVNIETIEAFAFFKVSNMASFTFYGANITTIEPRAFYKISSSDSFHIYMSTITNLHSLALDGFTDMKDVIILGTHIANLHQNTLEAFQSDIGEEFSLYDITIGCGCKVMWLLEVREYMSDVSLSAIKCSSNRGTPLAVRGETLSAINDTDMCPHPYNTVETNSSMKLLPLSWTLTPLENSTGPQGGNSSSAGCSRHPTASHCISLRLVILVWICVLYIVQFN